MYDILKQKDKIHQFVVDSDSSSDMKKRKTLHIANNANLDKILIEWIHQQQS